VSWPPRYCSVALIDPLGIWRDIKLGHHLRSGPFCPLSGAFCAYTPTKAKAPTRSGKVSPKQRLNVTCQLLAPRRGDSEGILHSQPAYIPLVGGCLHECDHHVLR
jgi:hypothetical protein